LAAAATLEEEEEEEDFFWQQQLLLLRRRSIGAAVATALEAGNCPFTPFFSTILLLSQLPFQRVFCLLWNLLANESQILAENMMNLQVLQKL
jgi:hypothetical protein